MIKQEVVVIADKTLTLPYSKEGKGHYFSILERTVEQLDALLSFHCQVLVYRIDLHLYGAEEKNAAISRFIKNYRQGLARTFGLKRLGFIWCREQLESDKAHYHAAFIVDANKHQKPHDLIALAEWYWQDLEIGFLFVPKSCYLKLRRGDSKTYQAVIDRLSYLAKVHSKGLRSPTTNDYSASRFTLKA